MLDVYVRFVIEGYLFLLVLTLTEIYRMKFGTSNQIISYVLSVIILGLLIDFFVLVVYQWKSSNRGIETKSHKYFKELFASTKDNKYSRAYTILFIGRLEFLFSLNPIASLNHFF